VCTKYYGRKAAYVGSGRGIIHALNQHKFIKEAVISETEIVELKSRGGMIILDEPIQMTRKDLKRIFQGCKGKIDVGTCSKLWNLSREIQVGMANVKHLLFTINSTQDFEIKKNMFLNMNALKRLEITLDNTEDEEEEGESKSQDFFIDIMKEIVKSKTLQSLTFNLQNAKINHFALAQALELLSRSNVTSWHLNIPLVAADFDQIDEMKTYLGLIDLLVIDSKFSCSFDGSYVDGWEFVSDRDNDDLKQILKDKNKVLQVSYNQEEIDGQYPQSIDISKFITSCTGLRGLYLKSVGGKFFLKMKEIDLDSPLEDITLKFNNISYSGSRHWDQGVLDSIVSRLKKGIKSLRSLKLLCCRTSRFVPTSMDEQEQTDEIDLLGNDLQEIAKNSLLEEIEIYDRGVFVGPIKELLTSMNNLRKLTLNLGTPSEREKYWD